LKEGKKGMHMKIGVIGAGTMGQGIARTFAEQPGYRVLLCDLTRETADAGKQKIAEDEQGIAKMAG